MHLNPHAKCRSSKFNLKLFKKKKNGGHLNPGNTFFLQYQLFSLIYALSRYKKIVSVNDQEKTQSQTADKPVVP